MNAGSAGTALTALVWIELAVILLVVTNTAAATLTRERDAGTMDLLLATPMTSKYIIAGMLRGLVSFVIPLIIVPTVTVALFVARDMFRASGQAVTTPEALLFVPVMILVFCAAAAMIGLHRSLNSRKTTQAVMTSTAVVMGLAGVLWLCVLGVQAGGSEIAAVFMPLSPFPAMQAMIDYRDAFDTHSATTNAQHLRLRFMRAVTAVISCCVYMAIVVGVYKQMVRGFDMTVRKQQV
jgi:ABC-type transport system involved in multi-copper enzyme maturation permease subunit